MVVSNIFDFHPYLGKWSNLTNIFQMGCFNHQLVIQFGGLKHVCKTCGDDASSQFNWGLKPSIEGWSHTPPKTSMTGWKIHHLKMYFLLNMGIFQLVMLVFRGVYVFLFKNYHPLSHGQHWTPCSALDETRHCSREFSLKPQFFGYLKCGIIWFGKGIQSQWKRWMDVPESKK